jgi:hypothetical protein
MVKSVRNQLPPLSFVVGCLWICVILLILAISVTFTFTGFSIPVLAGSKNIIVTAQQGIETVTYTPSPATTQTNTPQFTSTTDSPALDNLSLTFTESPQPTRTSSPVPTTSPTLLPFFSGPTTIGFSVENRALEVYRFGNGSNQVLIIAGIHGGYEANTVKLVDQLIAHMLTHKDLIPADSTLFILRSLNPDGYAKRNSADGRANANGVDLNRNWSINWQLDWPKHGCWDFEPISAGPYPASEPETIALMSFILNQSIHAVVSYHSAAPGIYPSESTYIDASKHLAQVLADASGYPYPAIDMGCKMTGTLVDWLSSIGIAAVDMELSDHWNTDFEPNLNVVSALLAWRP